MSSDVIGAAAAVIMALGVCFTFLIMGLEGAIGGHVSIFVEVAPAAFSIWAAFILDHFSEETSESSEPAHKQAEPTEL